MMLTLDGQGQLAIHSTTGYLPLSISCLEDIHLAIERYSIDFISPKIEAPHLYTEDLRLLEILGQFQLQRACVIAAAALLETLPRA